MSMEILLQIFAAVAAGAGVYAAVRADLTRAILTAERAQLDATEAHKRLNKHIEHHNASKKSDVVCMIPPKAH